MGSKGPHTVRKTALRSGELAPISVHPVVAGPGFGAGVDHSSHDVGAQGNKNSVVLGTIRRRRFLAEERTRSIQSEESLCV